MTELTTGLPVITEWMCTRIQTNVCCPFGGFIYQVDKRKSNGIYGFTEGLNGGIFAVGDPIKQHIPGANNLWAGASRTHYTTIEKKFHPDGVLSAIRCVLVK
jgi:hypothetical protein